jgi:sarcosine/dimethylglycine N-methyltransferase
LTAPGAREAIELAGFRRLTSQDDTEASKAWSTQLRASGPPPALNLGEVMGHSFIELSTNLGRNLMEGRLGTLTAVFEAVPRNL